MIQPELEREVRESLAKNRKGQPPVIVAGLCPTNTAFTGEVKPGLGVMRGNRWSETESANLGILADYFPSLSAVIDWLKKATRNKNGQSKIAIDAQSLKNWGIDG